MQAAAPSDAIRPDLSEAPENQSEGPPEMSDWRGDGFQMQGSESETGLRVRSESARATHASGHERGAGGRTKNRIDEVRLDSGMSATGAFTGLTK